MMTDPRTASDDDKQHSIDPFLQSMTFATYITTTTTIKPPDTDVNSVDATFIQSTTVPQPRNNRQQHRFNDDCDCSDDECRMMMIRQRMKRKLQSAVDGYDNTNIDSMVSFVPPTIQDAIDTYKRQKFITAPIKRRQVRTLIHRDDKSSVAIWEWILPIGGEPLVEFSNPNVCRVVWMKQLSMKLQTVGKGIIGSSFEERSRRTLHDINENDIIFLGSQATGTNAIDGSESNDTNSKSALALQKQKPNAIGWIYDIPNNNQPVFEFDDDEDDITNNTVENNTLDSVVNEDNNTRTYDRSPAVMIIAKVPIHLLSTQPKPPQRGDEVSSMDTSYSIDLLIHTLQQAMIEILEQKGDESNTNSSESVVISDSSDIKTPVPSSESLTSISSSSTPLQWIKFDPKHSVIIRSILQKIQQDSTRIKGQQNNQGHDKVVVETI